MIPPRNMLKKYRSLIARPFEIVKYLMLLDGSKDQPGTGDCRAEACTGLQGDADDRLHISPHIKIADDVQFPRLQLLLQGVEDQVRDGFMGYA